MEAQANRSQSGFSLLEALVVLLLLSIFMAAIFRQITQVQARSRTEQNRLDAFQESREFVDQLSRDLRQAGYPNARDYNSTLMTSSTQNAIGLVKVTADELRFEGDVDGDGVVDSLRYSLVSSGTNCPCVQRSQVQKIASDPLTGQGTGSFTTSVEGVQNGTSTDPIFRAFDADGNEVTLPVDISTTSGANSIASIKTIQVSLKVQASSRDLETGQKPQTTVRTTIRLNNCSGATTGQAMSCLAS